MSECPVSGDRPLSDAGAVETILIGRALISGAALERARRLEAESGERIDRIAAKLGMVSDKDIAAVYAEHIGSPVLAARDFPDQPIAGDKVRRPFLLHHRVVPISETGDSIGIAMIDPLDEAVVRAVAFAVDKPVVRRVALPTDIEAALERLYGDGAAMADSTEPADEDRNTDMERLKDLASEAPVIRLVHALITRAVEMRASDIHIEAAENLIRIRYRIDGILHDMEPPPAGLKNAIVSRVKILARLNIAERRLPQDGRIRLAIRGKEIDFRVSVIPTIHGESIALRVLDREAVALDFDRLGFTADYRAEWLDLIRHTSGIVLVTGPTSSGKTTTLYASLAVLNDRTRKILTVEDPVEYVIDGINQVQVADQIGMTFANALRSFLRHNPNIMMLGELRDAEAARIAIQMALSGHLVLSTVHTNDAASAMTRLLDMDIEDYLLTATIRGVLAQRLVRQLCSCRAPFEVPADYGASVGWPRLELPPGSVLYRPIGCPACDGIGFRGRTMVFELLVVTDALRSLILRRAETREIVAEAVRSGMRTMGDNGIAKALAGETTLEEVSRVIRDT